MAISDIDKHKLYHLARGSRVLDDELKERVAYMLADPATAGDVERVLGVTPEQVEEMKDDAYFLKRVKYLSARKKRVPRPKTPSEYRDWALKRLYRIAQKAKHEKDQVSACKVLGIIAGELAKEKPSVTASKVEASALLSELEKAYEEDEK